MTMTYTRTSTSSGRYDAFVTASRPTASGIPQTLWCGT